MSHASDIEVCPRLNPSVMQEHILWKVKYMVCESLALSTNQSNIVV